MHPKPDYKKLYQIAKDMFSKSDFLYGPFDETYCTMRVFESAKLILEDLKDPCDRELVLVAAILHDAGKTMLDSKKLFTPERPVDFNGEEWGRHPKLGVPIAQEILTGLGYEKEFIDKACHLVKKHACRLEKEKSIELAVLQDADLIADHGYAAFMRHFLYSGRFKREGISDAIIYMDHYLKGLQEDDNPDLPNRPLNLEVSKKIMKKYVAIERKLVKEIAKTIDSELLN